MLRIGHLRRPPVPLAINGLASLKKGFSPTPLSQKTFDMFWLAQDEMEFLKEQPVEGENNLRAFGVLFFND